MRGEHVVSVVITAAVTGSSPHARGALLLHISWQSDFGIIPACAGSTGGKVTDYMLLGDHPRMRGEHRVVLDSPNLPVGIIPACAGSTGWTPCPRGRRWDHPRMRGEHG